MAGKVAVLIIHGMGAQMWDNHATIPVLLVSMTNKKMAWSHVIPRKVTPLGGNILYENCQVTECAA